MFISCSFINKHDACAYEIYLIFFSFFAMLTWSQDSADNPLWLEFVRNVFYLWSYYIVSAYNRRHCRYFFFTFLILFFMNLLDQNSTQLDWEHAWLTISTVMHHTKSLRQNMEVSHTTFSWSALSVTFNLWPSPLTTQLLLKWNKQL